MQQSLSAFSVLKGLVGVESNFVTAKDGLNSVLNTWDYLYFDVLVLRLCLKGIISKGLQPQLICCAPFPSITQYFRKYMYHIQRSG
jgi:hypothetical protein